MSWKPHNRGVSCFLSRNELNKARSDFTLTGLFLRGGVGGVGGDKAGKRVMPLTSNAFETQMRASTTSCLRFDHILQQPTPHQ